MPTLFKMSSEKEATDSPTVVIAETTSTASPRKTKKYVIIAVSAVLSAAIVLAAILIGMYFFTEAQKEIVKYTLTFNDNAKQEVKSDPNENVVQYHVSAPQQETWIVNDFNKDIQVVKIQTAEGTNCYINALNRSAAMDPTKVAKPESSDIKDSSSVIYSTSGTPISDTSFLSKTARDICKGVSVYWVYPMCLDKGNARPYTNTTDGLSRNKRNRPPADVISHYSWGRQDGYTRNKRQAPYYDILPPKNGNPCIGGCCTYVCSCNMTYNWNVDSSGSIQCRWTINTCYGNPGYISDYGCYNGPNGVTCPNQANATFPSC